VTTGTVKWFNSAKGFGFIQPDSGEADAFVHISAVERAGINNLNEGQRVKYDLVAGRNGKSSAENLSLV
jgi:CspA family cold shock protein